MQDGGQPAIDRLAEGLEGELGAVGVVQPGRGHDRRQAHARVLVAHRLLQEGDVVGELTEGMPDDVGGGGARLELLGLEQAPDEFAVGLVLRPGRPERFAQVVLVGRVLRVELRDPRLDRGEHLGGRTGAQFAAGAVAGAVFGLLEVGEQFGDGGAGDLGGLDQRPPGVGDAVDATVLMVAVRVARVVLHVPDQRVVPIEEVQRAIGRELQVYRAEIPVRRAEQVAVGLAHEARPVVALRPEADA